jgi:RNA polymerase sigma-70 factor (ECF subfamily)
MMRHNQRKMISPTADELLKGARAFDVEALGNIYDLYSPGIYRYAMRLLGDDSLAEDCVAETFSRFLKSVRMGRGPDDHLQAYLYRIAHNWITDSYRRQVPERGMTEDDEQKDDQAHPAELVEDRVIQEEVRLSLQALTPDQRQVVTLKYIEGWENEEIAAALQKPVGAVKALQHRAILALKKMLVE